MIKFVIRNNYTGAYIYEDLFHIKIFPSLYSAENFVRTKNLCTKIYEIEAVKNERNDEDV